MKSTAPSYETISIADFQRHNLPVASLAGERPLVVLFTRSDCTHSQEVAGTLENLAQDYRGRLDFLTIDITKDGQLARSLQVHFTPALVVIRNGQVLYQALGSLPERELIAMFDSAFRSRASTTPGNDCGNA